MSRVIQVSPVSQLSRGECSGLSTVGDWSETDV